MAKRPPLLAYTSGLTLRLSIFQNLTGCFERNVCIAEKTFLNFEICFLLNGPGVILIRDVSSKVVIDNNYLILLILRGRKKN